MLFTMSNTPWIFSVNLTHNKKISRSGENPPNWLFERYCIVADPEILWGKGGKNYEIKTTALVAVLFLDLFL